MKVCVLRHLKQELAWAIDKIVFGLLVIQCNFKTVYTIKNLKNKAALNENNIVSVAMWPSVM